MSASELSRLYLRSCRQKCKNYSYQAVVELAWRTLPLIFQRLQLFLLCEYVLKWNIKDLPPSEGRAGEGLAGRIWWVIVQ